MIYRSRPISYFAYPVLKTTDIWIKVNEVASCPILVCPSPFQDIEVLDNTLLFLVICMLSFVFYYSWFSSLPILIASPRSTELRTQELHPSLWNSISVMAEFQLCQLCGKIARDQCWLSGVSYEVFTKAAAIKSSVACQTSRGADLRGSIIIIAPHLQMMRIVKQMPQECFFFLFSSVRKCSAWPKTINIAGI